MKNLARTIAPLQIALLISLGAVAPSGRAADHLDSPSVDEDGRLDLNDLFAFQSPANPNNTVLIMTVNPLAGVLSDTTFNRRGIYEFHVDNNNDQVADVKFRVYFSRVRRGTQSLLVTRENGQVIASGKTEQVINVAGGGQVRAGLFDDPFFFDLLGFQDNFQFTGDDFFEGANVSAIVLEVPSSVLGGPSVAVWARTEEGGDQFDRMGRPAINTVLIPAAKKDAFNVGKPADDAANFGADVEATITALNGGDAATAQTLTGILLPDVLTVDVSNPAGFLNGRKLDDDVIDAELDLLTKGAVTTDSVGQNDVPFQNTFPYLAPPHANE